MRWMVLAFPIVILIDLIVFLDFFQWHEQSIYEFEQRQLDLQVNYAVSAAAQEMLENGTSINSDYIDWGTMTIEPEVALDAYMATLLRNYGWADTPTNREDLLESSIPFFLVAAYDGYYVYGIQRDYEYVYDSDGNIIYKNGSPVEQATFRHVWSPKIPYSKTVKYSDTSFVTYFYNLGKTFYGTFEYDMASKNKLKFNNELNTSEESFGHDSLNEAKRIISETLTEACNNALFLGLEGRVQGEWYIPASYSEWSRNQNIESPTVLTYVTGLNKTSLYDTASFGIGGAKIDEAEFCLCYTLNDGQKLYTYAYNREKMTGDRFNGYKLDSIVSSAEEAALNGYYYDIYFVEVE